MDNREKVHVINPDFTNNYFFFFETNKKDKDNYLSYYFTDPVKILRLDNIELISDFFNEMNDLRSEYYLAGFFSYELGYLFEEPFKNIKRISDFPYALFCAYKKPAIFDHNMGKFIQGNFRNQINPGNYSISNPELNVPEHVYKNNIQKIREYIFNGDVYQANFTIKYKFNFNGSPLAFYNDLKQKQHTSYNVFARFDDMHILSLSPELFFRKQGNTITVKPMKGTWQRGRTYTEDKLNIELFTSDDKNKSENIMIVDLLRNDLGKISKTGSVRTTKLHDIEKYNNLFQMTSTVISELKKNISVEDLIKSLFPSGSITGAPKIRSMEIIKELEKEDRKIYTGAMGFFKPDGDSVFNVAIRTILLNGNKGEMGIGGGIVYDSTPEDEFRECKLKAEFLISKALPEFSLIETILYDDKYENLDLHMNRLRSSAEYFDYIFNQDAFEKQLTNMQEYLRKGKFRIRVLLNRLGKLEITSTKVEDSCGKTLKIYLSNKQTSSSNIYLFHKTTHREFYDKELEIARSRGFFDIIFMNELGEITEGAVSNIYVEINDQIFTPPVGCGLLNGTTRQKILTEGRVFERILTLQDLYDANTIYISNAIIGFRRCEENQSSNYTYKYTCFYYTVSIRAAKCNLITLCRNIEGTKLKTKKYTESFYNQVSELVGIILFTREMSAEYFSDSFNCRRNCFALFFFSYAVYNYIYYFLPGRRIHLAVYTAVCKNPDLFFKNRYKYQHTGMIPCFIQLMSEKLINCSFFDFFVNLFI